jgi:hypothetical protein
MVVMDDEESTSRSRPHDVHETVRRQRFGCGAVQQGCLAVPNHSSMAEPLVESGARPVRFWHACSSGCVSRLGFHGNGAPARPQQAANLHETSLFAIAHPSQAASRSRRREKIALRARVGQPRCILGGMHQPQRGRVHVKTYGSRHGL